MNKPTVHDIAREAGVSLSTVDRVLNERSGVRAFNVEKVKAAVEKLGYVRDTNAANLAKKRQYRFLFVLPDGASQFVDTLSAALNEAVAGLLIERVTAQILHVDATDPHAIVLALESIDPARCDGVAIMAPETPQVRDAILHLKEAGLPVVALVSNLPNSNVDHFVGVNNRQAGKTAALLLGRFIRRDHGSILVVTNSMLARDSIERRYGLDELMAQDFPGLGPLPTVELHDDPHRIAQVVSTALQTHADLAGIYSMATGNAALLDCLRRAKRLNDLVFVAHELTPVTSSALLDGEIDAVIKQDVGHLVRSALRVLRAKVDGMSILPAQERIRIEIVIRENLL
ncbi:MAG: LacI family DNA-binding transcriptional regulator [Roseibium sp.]|nr:LacI family DNA-binding transcriptional regulator [Roseibium sp.]